MQLNFNAISEPSEPGAKWQKIFNTYWPVHKARLNSKSAIHLPDLKTSQDALKYYMPEMWPTYERLCSLANADVLAARFLTGFQPPAYISGCSQAVTIEKTIQLVRNYDYHPHLLEGILLRSTWNGKKVIAVTDCLWGVLDGINEDGLVISLTFGGRKEVGRGFGIPFILRYVLEFCSNVQEAIEVLIRVPSHMSYNVTVIDRTGVIKTVQMAPDKSPVVTDARYTTNHQGTIDWPENAIFNKTVERAVFLENRLSGKELKANQLADAFLQPPLYSNKFKEGFGTLYTAIYRPVEGSVQLRWPNEKMVQTFDNFKEQSKVIKYQQSPAAIAPVQKVILTNQRPKGKVASSTDSQEELADSIINEMAQFATPEGKKRLKILRKKLINQGQISWGIIADYWKKWRK